MITPDTYDPQKFREFDNLIIDAKSGKFGEVMVAWPSVLGDIYDEIMVNLSKIAESGLRLTIVDAEPRLKDR